MALRDEISDLMKEDLVGRIADMGTVTDPSEQDAMRLLWVLVDSVGAMRLAVLRLADEIDAIKQSID